MAWFFNFLTKGISVMDHRLCDFKGKLTEIIANWPRVTYRDLAQLLGQLSSMYPVLEGKATLYVKMIQLFVNIRNYNNFAWEGQISAESDWLFVNALSELQFWARSIGKLNFRSFEDWVPDCCAWVDASGHAVVGVLARLRTPAESVPVTMDNWLLDRAELLPHIRNCVRLQVDVGERGPTLVTEHDLDPAVVQDLTVVHRNLTYLEKIADSNERELLAAIELLTACLDLIQHRTVTLHFDNLNAAIICGKGSPKYRLHSYALRIANLCSENNVCFRAVWIPRCLNNTADQISKMLDY